MRLSRFKFAMPYTEGSDLASQKPVLACAVGAVSTGVVLDLVFLFMEANWFGHFLGADSIGVDAVEYGDAN